MVGKLTKLAAGVLMTHYTRSAVDPTCSAGSPPRPAATPDWWPRVAAANTARHAYELWEAGGLLRPAGDALCAPGPRTC